MKPQLRQLIDCSKEHFFHNVFDSPVGRLSIVSSNTHLLALQWLNEADQQYLSKLKAHHPILEQSKQQLDEYFQKKRKTFQLPLLFIGTDFQKKAWEFLKQIPYGETRSYQQQAIALGDANKVRAVGGANKRNTIAIIVPCHRVINKQGGLHGFASGLEAKKFLLKLEGSYQEGSSSK